ncbi:MAG TPA: LCP family protein [Ktedonobacteraceae bacterium]|nr:LCP family protein [Ktedonobacteraceae bacterium]
MQLCPNCGTQLPDGARFCGKCGRISNIVPNANQANQLSGQDNGGSIDAYPVKRHARQPYRYTPPADNDAQSQPFGQSNPSAQPNQPSPANASSWSPAPVSAYNQNTSRVPDQSPSAWQPGTYSSSPAKAASYPNEQPFQSYNAQPPAQPLVLPPATPAPASGNAKGFFPFRRRSPNRPRRRRGCAIGCLGVLLLLVIFGIIVVPMTQKVLAFGSAISTQAPLSSQTGYMNTSDRVNILIMGYGGAGHDGAYLTDSMMVMSLIPSTHHTTLISVPRDLWVQNPANSGNYTKINAVYPVAAGNTNTDPVAGGNAAAAKVSQILGMQVNYWLTINFAGFKDFIDAIGGIDVNVPDGFTTLYPANDDPSINPNWMTVVFSKGLQHMNGARAISYARAREVTVNLAEGTDFARSKRQQLIMQAALAKLKDWHNWSSLYNAMGALQKTIYTNLSLADLGEFALHMDLTNAHHLGLSNQNVLVDATSSDGQSILQPGSGGWPSIITYVKNGLYN